MPMIRKNKNDKEEAKTDPKGASIEERSFSPEDGTEFGHWKGDTIIDSTNIKHSRIVFTLVERKTIFQITIQCYDKKVLTIYKAVKKVKENILN